MSDLLVVLLVILLLVVIWRGPKTLPQIGNMLGRGVKQTRREIEDIQKDGERDEAGSAGPPPDTGS